MWHSFINQPFMILFKNANWACSSTYICLSTPEYVRTRPSMSEHAPVLSSTPANIWLNFELLQWYVMWHACIKQSFKMISQYEHTRARTSTFKQTWVRSSTPNTPDNMVDLLWWCYVTCNVMHQLTFQDDITKIRFEHARASEYAWARLKQ